MKDRGSAAACSPMHAAPAFLLTTARRYQRTLALIGLVALVLAQPASVEAEVIRHAEAQEIARQEGWIVRQETTVGVIELQAIVDGVPKYYMTTNADAADSISTDECLTGGSSGLELTGSGVTLGIWDGGGVRTSHQEYGGRATQIDSPGGTHYHSTHVAGTMIASGVVSSARGMSPAASLDCYDWNSDAAEMATAAAAGLLVSNHSYSFITGWSWNSSEGVWYWYGDVTVSPIEDHWFGLYTTYTEELDQMALDYPCYLICRSAGNDRNDDGPGPGGEHYYWDPGSGWTLSTDSRDPDGDYDCLSTLQAAKNILTVGAAHDVPGGHAGPNTVAMSSFSSWGPTDDGRIKPDISGNGVGLYSTDDGSDTDYTTLSGTSMSSPNVSGSLGLLIQHWRDTHSGDGDMRSATVKGLVIHTADETGLSDGPDYEYGWGLMNTLKAANMISADVSEPTIISEQALNEEGTFELTVSSDGSGSDLRATICWTDPPGVPPGDVLDPPDKMLVDDLDLRIEASPSGTIYYPWVLDPANPSAAATTGDNDTDNIEQVVVNSPSGGDYVVRVTHKGSLAGGSQPFSLIITTSDCNDNGVPDAQDIAAGTSQDCQTNGIPDECEEDCNTNGTPDDCDIRDCDGSTWCGDCQSDGVGDGILDECQLGSAGGLALIGQPPNQSNGYFSDIDCDSCSQGQQFVAENLVVAAAESIQTLRFWGAYYPDNIPQDPDNFTVIFRDDEAGLPGSVITQITGPATTKATTGIVLFGVDEYVYSIDFDPSVDLGPGTFWVQIYNDTVDNTDSWFWEVGDLDVTTGIAGSAYSLTIPEDPWYYDDGVDLALEVITLIVTPPNDCNTNGIPDDCDIMAGTSSDVNSNGVPDECDECLDSEACDDGVFCNGDEICQDSTCVDGVDPCQDDCAQCNEGTDTCDWCIFDLDQAGGGIGTGDFGIFSGCFGLIYPPGHPSYDDCLASNFDDQFGEQTCGAGSDPDCYGVGTGDFGVFSGCFALYCSDCPNCWGSGGGRDEAEESDGAASVQLVAVGVPTPADVVDILPESSPSFVVGRTFYLELWASGGRTVDGVEDGLAAVYVDLEYDASHLTVEQIIPGDLFSLLSYGVIEGHTGEVSSLGGCAPLGEGMLGTGSTWVRVATLEMRVRRPGLAVLQTGPSAGAFGIAIFNRFGDLDASQIEFGRAKVTLSKLPHHLEVESAGSR